jgi:aminopeptidase N
VRGHNPDATVRPIVVALPPAPDAREDGRLPPTALPLRYGLKLRIDPTSARFSGTVAISLRVPAPTATLVLNARDMNVSRAVVVAGSKAIPAKATMRLAHGGVVPEELVLAFSEMLPAGVVGLTVDYDAPFAEDLTGLYRATEGGRTYAFTQFEAVDARRAFPCFDEPGFKTPYDVTIAAPRGMIALSNMREASSRDLADGFVEHNFGTSPPLPTYLVAFAVGDFDTVDGQAEPFPIRVVTTKGHAALTRLALDAAAALMDKLGEYFGMRYPFEKLDLVAVPDFAAGAMENPGLITFRDVLLLLDPARATVAAKRAQAEVMAHEFAHQWFGDLVTSAWWDDLWLNEGFATWAEAKIVDGWKPSFGATMEQIAATQSVMDTDALMSARAVRQPVHSTGEAMEAFDGITYEKGAATLRMLESWLGPDIFRRGVQRYVHENAWGNARAQDLFDALDYVSAQRVSALAAGFLDQPGVPEVVATWSCEGAQGSTVSLRQSEWRPLGESSTAPSRSWTLPVCVATDVRKAASCFTLGSDPIARGLGGRCPVWLYPNADQSGYYRFVLDRPKLVALAGAARSLSAADRLGLVSNAWAGVRQGALAPSVLLDLLPAMDADPSRHVVDAVVQVLNGMEHALVDDDDLAAFRKYAAARLLGRKRSRGWTPSAVDLVRGILLAGPKASAAAGPSAAGPKASAAAGPSAAGPKASAATGPSAAGGEDDDRAIERRTVLWTLGEVARDRATLDEAEQLTVRWLGDPTSVSSEAAAVAVPLASIEAGAARLSELRAAARSAVTPQDRVLAVRAMGMFDDPAVLRSALDLTLSDELKLSEMHYVFGAAGERRTSRDVLYAWEKDNWPKLRTRVPGSLGRHMLTSVASTFCTAAARDDARAFFVPAMQDVAGAKRPLDEALEWASLCIALHDQGSALARAWLSAHAPK